MPDFRKSSINSTLRKVLKRFHYPLEVMPTCVRWKYDAHACTSSLALTRMVIPNVRSLPRT